MKKINKQFGILYIFALILVGMFLFLERTEAQVDQAINFSGKVTGLDGSEVSDGVYDFSFSLYSNPSGGGALWSETLDAASSFSASISSSVVGVNTVTYSYSGASATTTLRVGQYLSNGSNGDAVLIADFDTGASTITVVDTSAWSNGTSINNRPYVEGGVVDVDLGMVSDMSGVNFSQALYLEISFDGETMRPRKELTPVAQALNADRLDGLEASSFANLGQDATVSGEWSFENIVDISTSSTQTALTIVQSGNGDIVDFSLGTSTAFAVLGDGRVQIGDYYFPSTHGSPGYVLKTDASGNMYWDVDYAGAGGGSGLWATSTDSNLVFQSDSGQVILLGNTATSSPYDIQFEVEGFSWFDNIGVSNQQVMRLYDLDSSNYFGLRASSSLSSDYVITLPGDVGSTGETLITDGSGNLSWGTPTGAGTIGAGTTGQLPYYAADGSSLTSSSSLYLASNGYLGIGTTSPSRRLSVNGSGQFAEICIGNSCITDWGLAGSIDGSGVGGQFTYWIDGNTLGATSSVGLSSLDSSVMLEGENISLLNNDAGYITDGNTNWDNSYNFITLADLSAPASGLDYNNSNGQFTISTGYILPLAASSSDWQATYTIVDANNANWTSAYSQLQASSSEWAQAYTWGDHSGQNYFDLDGAALAVSEGGTGRDAWTQYAIPYMVDTTTFGQIGIGSSTYLLAVNSSGDGYEWISASSTGVDTQRSDESIQDVAGAMIGTTSLITVAYYDSENSISYEVDDDLANYSWTNIDTTYLTAARGGTGWDSSAETGFAYLDSGSWTASNTISAANLDLLVMLEGENISLLNNDSAYISDGNTNWDNTYSFITLADLSAPAVGLDYNSGNGQFSISSGYIIPLAASTTDWQSSYTLVDANSGNWTSAYSQVQASSTEWTQAYSWGDHSVQNYFDLDGVALAVSEGGTGRDSWTANTLVYASAADTLASVSAGSEGQALVMQGGVPTWSSTAPGTAHGLLSALHTGTEATSTQLRGDLLVVNSSNNYSRMALGQNGYILRSNGSDPEWVPTVNITELGTITSGTWNADILEIAYGGTGSSTASGARENLDLDEIYDFAINSSATSGYVWMSDGVGRGRWVASTTLMSQGSGSGTGDTKFIGTTTVLVDGNFATSTLQGYQAANDMCAAEYSGAHFCRVYDILVTVEQDDISSWGASAWVAEGPPGYTSNSNDCQGWTSNSGSHMGAFWAFDPDGGGMGWLTNCSVTKPIACCSK